MIRSPMPPRSKPLKATTINPSARRMKSSQPSPTKAQSSRMGAIKVSGCMACLINETRWQPRCDGEGSDAHHLLSGGRRRGHEYTIALCPWHHRSIRPDDCPNDCYALHRYGPTVRESRMFRETYGTDDELLAKQNALIEGNAE
jgi:hypothetical protein